MELVELKFDSRKLMMEHRFDLRNYRYSIEKFPDGHEELVLKECKQSGVEWVEKIFARFKSDPNVNYNTAGCWTYVFDEYGHFGKACKGPQDTFNLRTGIAIAYARMKGIPVHEDYVCDQKDDNEEKERDGYNGWVMCLDNSGNPCYTPGKLYKFHDGILTADDGFEMKKVSSFEEWEEFSESKWKEMTNDEVLAYTCEVQNGNVYKLIEFEDLINDIGICKDMWDKMRNAGVVMKNDYTYSDAPADKTARRVIFNGLSYFVPCYALVPWKERKLK